MTSKSSSDCYEDSVLLSGHQPTTGLAAATLVGWRVGGRQQFPCSPFTGWRVGARLFPGSLATSTPQAFLVATWSTKSSTSVSPRPSQRLGVHCCPAHREAHDSAASLLAPYQAFIESAVSPPSA
jgi:hypothetical protein